MFSYKIQKSLAEFYTILLEEHFQVGLFGPKRDEVTGGWRKLHNEELHNLYASPSIIRMMKSRMRWQGM
jgi:hypothetical protein